MKTIAGGGVLAMQVFRWRRHSNYLECESDARASLVFASVGKKKRKKPPVSRRATGISFPKAQLDEASLEATPKQDIHIKLPSCGRRLEINVKRRYDILWITFWRGEAAQKRKRRMAFLTSTPVPLKASKKKK